MEPRSNPGAVRTEAYRKITGAAFEQAGVRQASFASVFREIAFGAARFVVPFIALRMIAL